MPGTLYLVPVPLGEVAPSICIPSAVLEQVRQLDYFVAESAKSARRFLKAMGVGPVAALEIREFNTDTPEADLNALLAPLSAGRDGGVLTEAGVPGVADPGSHLVRLAHARGLRVAPLIGPSSILLALMASGLNGQRFAFHGYLPVKQPDLSRHIESLERASATRDETELFIETPYRNLRLFEALCRVCKPSTWLALATDLSLESESVKTQRIAAWRGLTPAIDRRPTVFLLLAERHAGRA